MKKDDLKNPFPTTGYRGAQYFCDREEETSRILNHLNGGETVLLMGVRRLGKTALIHHILGQLPTGWHHVYVDILHTESERDLLNVLATSLLHSIPEKSSFGKQVWTFIKAMRPTLSFDPLSGAPQVSMDVSHPEKYIRDVFQYLAQSQQPILMVLDEFQQIAFYPEQHTDAWLRGIIQQLSSVRFLFSGSQQHLLNDLFNNPGKPFFKSASPIRIGKIKPEPYREFIARIFRDRKRQIAEEVVDEMLHWTQCHTYYVQLLCNRVYQNGAMRVDSSVWQAEAFRLLEEHAPFFYHYRELLSHHQWSLLKAVGMEFRAYEPTSKAFIARHKLGSPATVLRSLEALLTKDMIYRDQDESGKDFFSIYDVLFHRWLESRALTMN